MNTTQIHQLISQNQLSKAIQQLQKKLAGTAQKIIIDTIAGEYNDFQEKELMCTMPPTAIQQQKNNLRFRLLKLLAMIPADDSNSDADIFPRQASMTQRTINQYGKNSVYMERNDGPIHFE